MGPRETTLEYGSRTDLPSRLVGIVIPRSAAEGLGRHHRHLRHGASLVGSDPSASRLGESPDDGPRDGGRRGTVTPPAAPDAPADDDDEDDDPSALSPGRI